MYGSNFYGSEVFFTNFANLWTTLFTEIMHIFWQNGKALKDQRGWVILSGLLNELVAKGVPSNPQDFNLERISFI